MFPSGNYFRDIPCPFFTRVTCPRPHCHFKHTSQSITNSSASSTSLQIPPDANETLNKLISQLSTPTPSSITQNCSSLDFTSILQTTIIQSLTNALTNALNAVPAPPAPPPPPPPLPPLLSTTTTNLSPINNNEDLSQKQLEAKANSTLTKKEPIPEYRPTPIAELERRKRAQQLSTSNGSDMKNKTKYCPTPISDSKDEKKEFWATPSSSLSVVSKSNEKKKSRLTEIDLDRVKVDPKIRVDQEKKISLKRSSSSGPSESVEKKAKIVKKNVEQEKEKEKEKDKELSLFDSAVSSTRKSSDLFESRSNHTRAQTAPDGRRIAHQPKVKAETTSKLSVQPIRESGLAENKIPFKVRQDCLNLFLKDLQKQKNNKNESLSDRVRTIEKEIFDKSTNKNTYLNLAARQLRAIRNQQPAAVQQKTDKNSSTQRLVVSHSALLSTGQNESNSPKATNVDVKSLTENQIYTLLMVYRASREDLAENGYPQFSPDFPNKVLIKQKNPLYNPTYKILNSDPTLRICCRCGKSYRVNERGEHLTVDECQHHWGRIRPLRVGGQIDKRYSCCDLVSGSRGCSIAQCHVYESNESEFHDGFVKTEPLKKTLSNDQSAGIFAVDCEMCYTTKGLELVRVSVINHKLQMIMDSLVLPSNPIIDYNTRWSGIQAEDLKNCHVRLEDIQRRLLTLFNSETLLIGHSLESDLKALKIVHGNVVDTSLVFPHAKGKPFKRALKTLASEFLMKIIQESASGHSPIEDATVSMELMLWKINGDLKGATKR